MKNKDWLNPELPHAPDQALVDVDTKILPFTVTPIEGPIAIWRAMNKAKQEKALEVSNEKYEANKERVIDIWLAKDRNTRVVEELLEETTQLAPKESYLTWVRRQKKQS